MDYRGLPCVRCGAVAPVFVRTSFSRRQREGPDTRVRTRRAVEVLRQSQLDDRPASQPAGRPGSRGAIKPEQKRRRRKSLTLQESERQGAGTSRVEIT